jgi:hypothetical protein
LTAGVVFLLVINGTYVLDQFRFLKPFGYIGGNIGRDDYIETYRPGYAAFRYANQNISKDSIILGVFIGDRRYYSDREMDFRYHRLLFEPVTLLNSAEDVLGFLKRHGITHLLIRFDLFWRWVQDNLNNEEMELLNRFIQTNTSELYSKGGYGLFELN